MNPFYYDRTNQEWSLIKLVSAETQGAHSPCPKDLTIRTDWGRAKRIEGMQNEFSDYNLFPWLVWRGGQEKAKIGWTQEKCGAAAGSSRLHLQLIEPFQSILQFLPCPPHPCIPRQGEEVSSKLQLHGNIAVGGVGSAQTLLSLPKTGPKVSAERKF